MKIQHPIVQANYVNHSILSSVHEGAQSFSLWYCYLCSQTTITMDRGHTILGLQLIDKVFPSFYDDYAFGKLYRQQFPFHLERVLVKNNVLC